MSETITITINDQEIQTQPGQMLIDVADANNITIPRFCYHKKLSVAANCRMCLVEVEKAPKPMPACATPINDGMVVKTRSSNAVAAQKSTMEFLLINHPLDCPICDQGGECELQDVAMDFGGDVSRYTESKRVVKDKNIGPLIATEMTRCILCTRCVRFGEEIAGLPELGATGRGEFTEIGTYVEKSVSSELSGNVIDLCPVGALTAKPSRYTSRPWELVQHKSIAANDCVGSNIFVHTRGQKVMRVVPRDNEQVNETWISDLDRFSYEALNSDARLSKPMLRKDGKLVETDWETAINLAVEKLQAAANQKGNIAALVSPSATLEEHYLLQKLLTGLGSRNIDHRLKQVDFSAQDKMPVMPWLGRSIESLQDLDAALLVAANLRQEQPMINHRLRKAVVKNAARVSSIASLSDQYNYDLLQDLAGSAEQVVHDLAAVLVAVADKSGKSLSDELSGLLKKVKAGDEHVAIAESLIDGEQTAIILGVQAVAQADYSLLVQIAEAIADMSGATLGQVSEGANSAGACLAGVLPHRAVAGAASDNTGRNAAELLVEQHKVLMLMGIDPARDITIAANNGPAAKALADNNEFIIALNSFDSEFNQQHADLVLPLATSLESAGTFVNVEGLWQSFNGCANAAGDSRPGWKILTALAQVLLPADDYSYADAAAVRNELKEQCRDVALNNLAGVQSTATKLPARPKSLQRVSQTAIYAVNEMARNAADLQQTQNMQQAACLQVNSAQAQSLGITDAEKVHVQQGDGTAILSLMINESVPTGCVWIASGLKDVAKLSTQFGPVNVEKV